jgi:hypothetical protein
VEPWVGEQQGMKWELVVFLLGPEVDRGRRSMVSSTRKMTAVYCTHPEASLTGSWATGGCYMKETGRGPSGRLNEE